METREGLPWESEHPGTLRPCRSWSSLRSRSGGQRGADPRVERSLGGGDRLRDRTQGGLKTGGPDGCRRCTPESFPGPPGPYPSPSQRFADPEVRGDRWVGVGNRSRTGHGFEGRGRGPLELPEQERGTVGGGPAHYGGSLSLRQRSTTAAVRVWETRPLTVGGQRVVWTTVPLTSGVETDIFEVYPPPRPTSPLVSVRTARLREPLAKEP